MVSKVTVNQLELAKITKLSQISLRRTLVLSLPEVSGVANSQRFWKMHMSRLR